MIPHKQLRDLCQFQYWQGTNYTTLPTSSVEMTERAVEYLKCKKAMVISIKKDICPYCNENEKYIECRCCEKCASD